MKLQIGIVTGVAIAGLLSGGAIAADPARTQQQTITQETVRTEYQLDARDRYGWDLMSAQERAEYTAKMRAARTSEERDRYRSEHHQLMQDRARAQGTVLPDMAPGGRGPMPGMGPGSGGGGGRR